MTTVSRTHSQMSMFDESSLNVSQFVQVTETFLGDEPTVDNFEDLMKFVKEEYQETEEEKMERLVKVYNSQKQDVSEIILIHEKNSAS